MATRKTTAEFDFDTKVETRDTVWEDGSFTHSVANFNDFSYEMVIFDNRDGQGDRYQREGSLNDVEDFANDNLWYIEWAKKFDEQYILETD